jgi:hypothetical protein
LRHSFLAAALAGVALISFEARAQTSTVHFGVAGGVAIPVSGLRDFLNTGFNGTVTVGLNPALIPLGIRLDGAYNQFSFKSGLGGGSLHYTSVTGNLVYKIPGASFSPYAIGGAGWYNAGASGGGGSSNDFGFNIGGGLSMALSGFDTFIEARFNQVQTAGSPARYVPITFGVMF